MDDVTSNQSTPVSDYIKNAEHLDAQVPDEAVRLLWTLSRHLPGGSLGLCAGQKMTYREYADALDYVVNLMRYWSDKAIKAEEEVLRISSDIAAVRRVFGI